ASRTRSAPGHLLPLDPPHRPRSHHCHPTRYGDAQRLCGRDAPRGPGALNATGTPCDRIWEGGGPLLLAAEAFDHTERQVGGVQPAVDLCLHLLVLRPAQAPLGEERLTFCTAEGVGALDDDVRVFCREVLRLNESSIERALKDRTTG